MCRSCPCAHSFGSNDLKYLCHSCWCLRSGVWLFFCWARVRYRACAFLCLVLVTSSFVSVSFAFGRVYHFDNRVGTGACLCVCLSLMFEFVPLCVVPLVSGCCFRLGLCSSFVCVLAFAITFICVGLQTSVCVFLVVQVRFVFVRAAVVLCVVSTLQRLRVSVSCHSGGLFVVFSLFVCLYLCARLSYCGLSVSFAFGLVLVCLWRFGHGTCLPSTSGCLCRHLMLPSHPIANVPTTMTKQGLVGR